MNRSLLKRVFPRVFAWAALVVLCCAVAVAQGQKPAAGTVAAQTGERSDGQIEMDVVHALDASKALKNDMITAATIQGEVTLTGTVSSDASSELAESIAGHVAGVTKVNNNLKVGNPQEAQAADAGAQQMADNQPEDAAQAPPAPTDGPLPMPSQGQDQGQAQAQGQPQAPYPPQRPQYAPPPPPYPQQRQYAQAPPQGPAYEEPKGPVTIPQGTLLQLRTSEALSSKRAKDGEPVQFTVIRDVAVGGVLALPKGATVHGVVSEVKRVGSGDLGGSSELALRLTSLDLGGQSYPLDSDQFKVKGPNKAGQTVNSAVGGGILGTIIGCAVGRGFGCAVGAGAGVAAGTAASAASSGPGVWIPAEALVTFHLNTPLTVNPVSAQEAARLAQGLYTGGPTLYRRGPYPYYGAQYAGAYPYGYGPVYYRPYYMVGGVYYWR
ncbi:MAG TPA: BON domain-containing protein [Terracidiphilus sp.]|nr:BON domain-containing protein [Terracidiphilus sp.]